MAVPRNIALTGFMGTGKSVVARALGRLTGYKVVDVDAEVERTAGRSINEIFSLDGEDAFRDMEAVAIKRISQGRGQVISTGGGAVLRAANMDALRTGGGVVVNLKASAEAVFERICHTRHTGHTGRRPLLQSENPLLRIQELMAKREEFYQRADIVVDTEGLSVMQVADEILESIRWKR